ncbi:ATP-binding protein [uncultured Microbacterium sp.]|uniref:ATP-binding protein n=1 Tax=uncultured Microbacterium sp. TaxID=191216 RepID=UPI002624C8CF|nr:ATP-binding protein [uncultured Microbacterium sp.]
MTTSQLGMPRLERTRSSTVAGVAEGIAAQHRWRVSAVRVMFVAGTAVFGSGALLYLWIWAFTPLRDGTEHVTRRAPVAWILLASAMAALLVIGVEVSAAASAGLRAPMALTPFVLPVVLASAAGVWSGILDRSDPARGPQQDLIVRGVATAVLTAIAALVVLVVPQEARTSVWGAALGIVLLTAIGTGLVWSATWVARFRELQDARVHSIREEQRARMAAHLHDSVLQTLALIQNRAGASSEVGRIARAQERELRSWLYEGDDVADSDLATDLRDFANALELDFETAVTVVSAGTISERASGEVAAAAREAMLNAARHAGGELSVYIEGSPGTVEVFIRDRGAGFDLAAVPSDRLGVRESIIGRMQRAGGSAAVGPGPGGTGTQVRIRYAQAGARA